MSNPLTEEKSVKPLKILPTLKNPSSKKLIEIILSRFFRVLANTYFNARFFKIYLIRPQGYALSPIIIKNFM